MKRIKKILAIISSLLLVTVVLDTTIMSKGMNVNAAISVITRIQISKVSHQGYRISCEISSNVKSVKFPAWSSSNGQDDIVWHEGAVNGTQASIYVNKSSHNNDMGKYYTHIYAYDANGNAIQSVAAPVVELKTEPQEIATTTYNGNRYTVYNADISWTVAKQWCKENGGHLVTVANEKEWNGICKALKQFNGVPCWLGAEKTGGKWKWVTGEDCTYLPWDAGQPDCNGGTEFYLGSYVKNKFMDCYNFNDYPNTYTTIGGFVCEYENTNSSSLPTIKPNEQVEFYGKKYERYDKALTWTEAKTFCENRGGHLVTINSKMEQSVIEGLINEGIKYQYWIGMNNCKTATKWITDEIIDYKNWGKAEPNATKRKDGEIENYAQILNADNPNSEYGKKYEWNDMYNDNTYTGEETFFRYYHVGFICEYEPSINKSSLTLKADETFTLTVKNGSVSSWKSSNTNIATVSNGKVTAKNMGNATITATLTNGNELKCKVYVIRKAQKIKAKSYTKVYGNKAFPLNAKISGNGKLSYKSSNKKVVTISSKGKVAIKGCGKTTITIKASETSKYKAASKKITITVKPQKLKIKSGSGNKKAYIIKFVPQKTISGYECTYKNGGKNHKIILSGNKKSVTLKDLVKGNCVVKIRAFKKVGQTKLYGGYGKISLSIS